MNTRKLTGMLFVSALLGTAAHADVTGGGYYMPSPAMENEVVAPQGQIERQETVEDVMTTPVTAPTQYAPITIPSRAHNGNTHNAMQGGKRVAGVEFSSMPAPQTDVEMLSTYSKSVATVTYTDGSKAQFPLSYNVLFKNTDKNSMVNGRRDAAAQLYNVDMEPILDRNGDPVIAETADGTSLLQSGGNLFLVNHWEYDNILANGESSYKAENWYSRMPMSMSLTALKQGANGKLEMTAQQPIDFKSVDGGWIFCFGGPTPWGTHMGGEEDYDLYFLPGTKGFDTTEAGLKAMSEVYFKGEKQANPYDYGYPVEVAVKPDGSYEVIKHYGMGRGTWETANFAADGRTAIYGDDGSYSGLFMFVGDVANNPRAGGTIYAAKWNQTSDKAGGTADIEWVRLGHGTHAEIDAMRKKGITAADIFEYTTTDPNDSSFRPVRAGTSETIWLKLKPGMEKAAAFFEPRRYAAYLGATTEFTKGEGVAFNNTDKKMYYAISYAQKSMKADDGGPVDHIRIPENSAGATYTFDLASGVRDTDGNVINSAYVATNAYVEDMLLGRPMEADAQGNTAEVDYIANTDNVFYSEAMRTLFIGEDSGNHVNNYVWAYNVDTKKLSRILSVAAGAEATGLGVAEDVNGYAYITSNNQHQGDWLGSMPEDLVQRLEDKSVEMWGANKYGTSNYKLNASVGYIGGLPAIK